IFGAPVLNAIASGVLTGAMPWPLYHRSACLVGLYLVALVTSFLMEWIFVLAALSGQPNRFRRSFIACAMAQLVSYAFLLPLYLLLTFWTVGTEAHVTRSLDFAAHKSASVFFISTNDDGVYRIRLDGSPAMRLTPDGFTTNNQNGLFIYKARNADRWDLWLGDPWASGRFNDPPLEADRLLLENVASDYPRIEEDEIDLRPKSARDWSIYAQGYTESGLHAKNDNLGQWYYITIASPLAAIPSRRANILPGDQVVYQLANQIMLFDVSTRQLAVIAQGRCPLVVLDTLTPTTMPATRQGQ
ncbi:MAG: hypothetical protein ACHRHE_03690, partial [Tepidisphaerales bacterium]